MGSRRGALLLSLPLSEGWGRDWGEREREREQSHRGLIQILLRRLAIAAWQAALQVIYLFIYFKIEAAPYQRVRRLWCGWVWCGGVGGGVIRLEFTSDETGDKLAGMSHSTEGCRKWRMQMRSAGFKAAVCWMAVPWHCWPVMDGGFHHRGPLGL